ncbi:MAG TPA: 50S ribosomal protein L25 [Polyangiaceae bacterium]|nr:50S ribosomal protein L25 [Polyangiaceae bacterium]
MATEMPTLKAQSRAPAGKSEAKRLRRTGLVPAIAYGKGLPSTPIAVTPKEVATILKSERGKNTVLELDLDGKKLLAMIRDFALHPVKRELEHVDFIEVKLDKPVEVEVPLFAIGKPVGVTKGGVLRVVHRTVPVRCLPDRIPVKIEADVTHLELGQHVATQDLKLPEGVAVQLPAEQTLVAVVAPEKEVEEVVTPGAAGAVPAGGSVAPAAPGAAAAGGAEAAAKAAPAKAAPAKDEKKKK